MTEYSIALAKPAHVTAIPAIEQAAASIFPEEDLPAEIRYLVTDRERLQAAQQCGLMWVALGPHQKPVGYAMAAVVDGNAHLDEVAVLPDHARRGNGVRLIAAVIDWAKNADFDKLTLVTFRHLSWNAPLYAKLGFAEVADKEVGVELRGMLAEEKEDGLNMTKRLVMALAIK